MGSCPDTDIDLLFLSCSICLSVTSLLLSFILFVCLFFVCLGFGIFSFRFTCFFFFFSFIYFFIFFSFNETLAYHWEPKFEDCVTFLFFHFSFVFCLFVCQAFVEKLTAVNSRIIMSSLPHAK